MRCRDSHLVLCCYTHLRRDAAPEVGVRSRGVQHGSDDRLVLRYQQVEGVGVGEDVVRVGELEQKKRDRQEEERPLKAAQKKEQKQSGKWGTASCERRYQDVVGPAFPGKVERRLLQFHHMLVSAVGPVFGTQLSCVGPEKQTAVPV